TVVIIVLPPGVPTTINSLPSFVIIVGVIELNILLLGAIAFASPPTKPNILGVPGLLLKSSISLFRRNPAPFTNTLLPNPPFKVVVTATALPSASTIEKWVVSSCSLITITPGVIPVTGVACVGLKLLIL